jgi:opacity protein-like surface antigen
MKQALATSLKLFLAALAGLALVIPAAQAKDRGNNGAGSMEFSVPIAYTGSTTVDGENGSKADVQAAFNMGFGMGYNFTDKFQVNGIFSWSQRNYSATLTSDGVPGCGSNCNYNNTLYTTSLQVNAVYYFMPGDFTPFVQGGFGTTYIDTNIPNGTGSSGCYWDPYWGYVCGTYQNTKTSSNISYSGGLGARYDVNRQFAVQGSYNKFYIDGSHAKPDFDIVRFDFIFRM